MQNDASSSLDLKMIGRLVRLMRRGEVTELEVDDSNAGLRIRLKRGPEDAETQAPVVHVTQGAAAPVAMAPMGAPGMAPHAAGPAPAQAAAPGNPPGTTTFNSPMVGTFYRSSSPDSDPFVSTGTQVGEDTTLCIIEAMKVMNEIKAETRGEVVQVLVENGEPVEFGQPLFLLKQI